MVTKTSKTIDDRHCSYCKWYATVPPFMYCTFYQRRITARKKPCKNYELDNNKNS